MRQTIPVVDLSDYGAKDPAQNQRFIQGLGRGLVEHGFVAIEAHGIDPEVVARTYGSMKGFFDLSENQKTKYELRQYGRQRGYTPFGKERAKDTPVADLKEFWHVGPEFDPSDTLYHRIPRNVWPTEIPDFKDATLSLWSTLHQCGTRILEALAEYLGAPKATFTQMVEGGNSVLRLIKYPKPPEQSDGEDAMWAAEHEDINLITLLIEATDPGLELRTRNGDWLPIIPVPGHLIVDTGDMMTRLTNGQIPAMTHRVRAPQFAQGPRYSIPFFMHPHPDVSLAPLDCCITGDTRARWPVETAETYLENRLRDNGVLTMDADADWLAGLTIDEDIE